MADYTVKRRDQGTVLQLKLVEVNLALDPDGVFPGPIDLTDVTEAKLQMKCETAVTYQFGEVVEDPLEGRIDVTWDDDDLEFEGSYQAEVQLARTDGSIETVPNDGYFTVDVISDLDPA